MCQFGGPGSSILVSLQQLGVLENTIELETGDLASLQLREDHLTSVKRNDHLPCLPHGAVMRSI